MQIQSSSGECGTQKWLSFLPTSQTPGSSHPPTPVEFLDYLLLQPLIRDFSLQLFHYALCNTQIMKGKKTYIKMLSQGMNFYQEYL